MFKWPSDGIYEGYFKGDFRHGYGVMRWADGTVYEGEWENGVQQGKGRLQMPDGTLKIGIFKDNILVEAHHSEIAPEALVILGSSDSSKQLTKLHETLLDCNYDALMKNLY